MLTKIEINKTARWYYLGEQVENLLELQTYKQVVHKVMCYIRDYIGFQIYDECNDRLWDQIFNSEPLQLNQDLDGASCFIP